MLFAYPSDLLGADAVVSSDGAIDAQHPLSNLHDGNPIDVTRWTTNAQTRTKWDHGAATTMEGLIIVLYTFAAGATLKVQAHPTDSWSPPDFSLDVIVPAWPDHLPANITVDLRGTALATTGFRWTSLLKPAQAANHAIGELHWIRQWTALDHRCVWPVSRSEVRRVSVNSTSHGVDHVIERRVRQKRLRPKFPYLTNADSDRVLTLARTAGANLGWPVVLDPDQITSAENYFVRFHPDNIKELEESLAFIDRNEMQLDLLEMQRGLPL